MHVKKYHFNKPQKIEYNAIFTRDSVLFHIMVEKPEIVSMFFWDIGLIIDSTKDCFNRIKFFKINKLTV